MGLGETRCESEGRGPSGAGAAEPRATEDQPARGLARSRQWPLVAGNDRTGDVERLARQVAPRGGGGPAAAGRRTPARPIRDLGADPWGLAPPPESGPPLQPLQASEPDGALPGALDRPEGPFRSPRRRFQGDPGPPSAGGRSKPQGEPRRRQRFAAACSGRPLAPAPPTGVVTARQGAGRGGRQGGAGRALFSVTGIVLERRVQLAGAHPGPKVGPCEVPPRGPASRSRLEVTGGPPVGPGRSPAAPRGSPAASTPVSRPAHGRSPGWAWEGPAKSQRRASEEPAKGRGGPPKKEGWSG